MKTETVKFKEFDGGRSVEMQSAPDFVFLEAGGHCYAFDRGLFLHGVSKMLGISVILEHGLEGDFALP